jgi:GT2 family glycosyltransferase
VDNASQDGSADMVAAEFPSLRLVRHSTNAGLSKALNVGIRLSSGEMVVLLNPDTELRDNVFPAMARYLVEHPDVGILGPRIVDEDGSLQLSCRRFPSFSVVFFNRYSLLTRLLPRNPLSARYLMTDFDHSRIAEVDWLSLACWMAPRRLFDEVGLLDEGYFLYNEDVDFCQRVHRAGRKAVYFPEVSVVHQIGASTSTLPNRSVIERHRSMWRYYRKAHASWAAAGRAGWCWHHPRCAYTWPSTTQTACGGSRASPKPSRHWTEESSRSRGSPCRDASFSSVRAASKPYQTILSALSVLAGQLLTRFRQGFSLPKEVLLHHAHNRRAPCSSIDITPSSIWQRIGGSGPPALACPPDRRCRARVRRL